MSKLTTRRLQSIIDDAPINDWTHYCTRNRQYFKRDGNTSRLFVWISDTKTWSVPLSNEQRWLERRERIEEILSLRKQREQDEVTIRALTLEVERLKSEQSEVAARAVEDAVKKYKMNAFAGPDIFSDGLLDYANKLRKGEGNE